MKPPLYCLYAETAKLQHEEMPSISLQYVFILRTQPSTNIQNSLFTKLLNSACASTQEKTLQISSLTLLMHLYSKMDSFRSCSLAWYLAHKKLSLFLQKIQVFLFSFSFLVQEFAAAVCALWYLSPLGMFVKDQMLLLHTDVCRDWKSRM